LRYLAVHNKDLSDWIVQNIDYDQCILEFWTPNDPNSGWVHCSYNDASNRKQYLKASKENGKIVYSSML
jgi:zinc D-Ala-D-Ala carboxypeptidase